MPKIATQKLYVGTSLAHVPGDVVPDENVSANGWQDGVAGADTKAAKEAQKPADGLSVPNGTPPAE